MARRATLSTKKQNREPAPSEALEQVADTPTRRGTRAKRGGMADAEQSLGDTAADVTSPAAGEPAKARRGRKPKSVPVLETPTPQASHNDGASPPTAQPSPVGNDEPLDMKIGNATAPERTSGRGRSGRQASTGKQVPASTGKGAAAPTAPTPAAKWDADTGTVTFDWPSIEQVAATEGPNQTMAKLLLAARAEGANSRWPF